VACFATNILFIRRTSKLFVAFFATNKSFFRCTILLGRVMLAGNGKLYAKCGINGDAFLSPATNFAKANKLRHQVEYPHFVYSMLPPVHYCYLFVNKLNNGSLM
jgi:hypothetical protein